MVRTIDPFLAEPPDGAPAGLLAAANVGAEASFDAKQPCVV